MTKFFFDSWESIIRTSVISVMAYTSLIFLLRVAGKRTLSKMNAFDFIVTIALGSTLATVLLNKNVALADGVLAFFLLIVFQYLISYFSARYRAFSNLVKATPALICYKGEFLSDMMKKERGNVDEVHATIREKGLSSLEQTEAIVLETYGSLTVIEKIKDPLAHTVSRLQNYPL
ncbi:MAG: DUF421 domain-containing protein [Chitinophagaceae bacterium]